MKFGEKFERNFSFLTLHVRIGLGHSGQPVASLIHRIEDVVKANTAQTVYPSITNR
jgi:hypothetical protein